MSLPSAPRPGNISDCNPLEVIGIVEHVSSKDCEIQKLLAGIIGQGWTQIEMRPVNVRRIGDVILLACAYTAIGSGANAGKTLDATSSHVLVQADGAWRSALHTAR
jgi:Domain of unknown function (DUF4440)